MEIIKDKSKLNKYVKDTIAHYQSTGKRVHTAFVSALYHAATTGYVETLNQLFSGLRSNDQTAVKMYVRRASAIVGLNGGDPEGLHTEEIQAAIENGKVLNFAKNEFSIAEGRGHNSKQAKALAELCEKRFINPDGETDKYVLDRNNFSEVRTLGDTDVLKQVLRSLKLPESTGARREVHVSKGTVDFLAKLRDQVETRLQQEELKESAPARSETRKSQRPAAA